MNRPEEDQPGAAPSTVAAEAERRDAPGSACGQDLRSLFETIPAQVFQEDFTGVMEAFAEMRAAGVHDFIAHTDAHPGLVLELAGRIRVIEVNATAVRAAGFADAVEARAGLNRLATGPWERIRKLQLAGLWGHRQMLEDDIQYCDASGASRACHLRYAVPRRGGSPDFAAVVSVVVDLTTTAVSVSARLEDHSLLRQTLAQANILLWWAKVRREGDRYRWKIDVPAQALDSPIYELATPVTRGGLWEDAQTPDLVRMRALWGRALAENLSGYEHEFRVVKDGRTHWLGEEVRISVLGPGEWSLVGVVTDVTSRRIAEEAQREMGEQLSTILERADCMLWRASVSENAQGGLDWGIFIPESVLHRRLFGENTAGAQPLMWSDLNVSELSEMNVRAYGAIRGGRDGYSQEFCARRDETKFWLHEQVSIRAAGPGRWDLVGVVTDISPRREAEAALAAEKERLTVTLRAMSEGVVTTDARSVVQFVNRAAEALLQCGATGAIGRGLSELGRLHDARSGAKVAFPVEQVVATGGLVDLPPHSRLEGLAGGTCLIEGCGVPVSDGSGRTIGAVLVFRDVTERRNLEEELQRASKLESVGILAGGIAHDFNNLLTAILGNLALLQMEEKGNEAVADCLAEAQRATLRARDLTQQLLTFAKGGDPVRSVVQLAEIVRDVAQFTLRGSRLRCDFAFAPDLWPADADKGQIGQVVQNLVINAAQAMPEGGTLGVRARNESVPQGSRRALAGGDYVVLSVSDTGLGIRPEHLARVFDPYFTTKQSGSGLGLATVYSIVRKHQGAVEVESEMGRGTTFHVWLPATRRLQMEAPAPKAAQSEKIRGRVLFMDDEEPIRRMAARLMGRLGLESVLVADGAEAVRTFASALESGQPFDVVMMDLTVPGGMGGCEALAQMRQIDPAVRAVVSSGYSRDPVLANFEAYGFAAMVAKPYQLEEFGRAIREVIAKA